jgi:putative membrane protein
VGALGPLVHGACCGPSRAHLMATGTLAVGDDWLGSVFGGSLLSRLSRRFGEGMVNAALTARVGRAAIDVCRPLPFNMQERPKINDVLRRALTGIFDKTPD